MTLSLSLILYFLSLAYIIGSVNTTHYPTPTPRKPRPRVGSLHSDMILGNIPDGYDDSTLSFYLEDLLKTECKEVKRKKGMAVVKMAKPIGNLPCNY